MSPTVADVSAIDPDVFVYVKESRIQIPSSEVRVVLGIIYDKKISILSQDPAALTATGDAPGNVIFEFFRVRDIIVLYPHVVIWIGIDAVHRVVGKLSEELQYVLIEYLI